MEENKTLDVAFARKYRPRNFDEYLGADVKKSIQNRFKNEKDYPQTVLLYGASGIGKTSMARLMAKEYLCMDKVDGHSCGICEMCQEIDEKLICGEAGVEVTGVHEVDVASDSGKKEMDIILEEALIPPMVTKYSIYILDEVHMASNASQNRLLKIMEQPPKHLIFILCTTNPEKILDTLKGRCQVKIEIKKPSVNEIADRLLSICKNEGIKASKEALRAIAVNSNRLIRDSISKLEEIAKENGGEVVLDAVRRNAGQVASEIYMEYYKCANNSMESILGFMDRLKKLDIDPKRFVEGLTRFTLDCVYVKFGLNMENLPSGYIKEIKSFFSTYNIDDIDCIMQILENANRDIYLNSSMGEVTIINTASRISKIKLLALGLRNEQEKAILETRDGNKKHSEMVGKSLVYNDRATDLNDNLIKSIFKHEVTEVKADIHFEEPKEENDHIDTGDKLTDEELEKAFLLD